MSETITWPLTEFLTVVGMIGASFYVIYSEIRAIRREAKEDFEKLQRLIRDDFDNIRSEKKADLDQLKLEFKSDLSDLKQTFKNDLFGHRTDLKGDILQLSRDQKKELDELRRYINVLTERLIIIDTTIAFLRDDHPINHPPYIPPQTEPTD